MFPLFLNPEIFKRLAIVDHLVLWIGFVTLQPSLGATFTHFCPKAFYFSLNREKNISSPYRF